jgi:hypothetical protein
MKKILLLLITVFMFGQHSLFAQDDLLKIASEGAVIPKEKVSATFKSTKIINAQTIETVHKRTLDFRVGHRFGNFGGASNGGYDGNFFGLYGILDVRIAFEYGITDRLMIGLSNNKVRKNVEGLIKYRLLEQRKDNKVPVAITVFANAAMATEKSNDFIVTDELTGEQTKKPLRRLSYVSQIIIARKFGSLFSCEVLPTYVHHNYVPDPNDENGFFSLGFAARLKITRSFALVGDYFYNFSKYRQDRNNYDFSSPDGKNFYNPLGLGIEIETGGHVFTIMATNASAIIENEFLTSTQDTWTRGGFKFSFNISRNFRL